MCVFGYDKFEKDDFCGDYVSFDEFLARSDVVSFYFLFMLEMCGMICVEMIVKMKEGMIFINISCGLFVDVCVVIDGLYFGRIVVFGLDVYENENCFFFKDFSLMNMNECMLVWDEMMVILGLML